ncbi:MFS transporter [Actinotalea fermentans]|uniref:Multidrug efflux MFS transporter NorB n=1 Tax=Actinotalea fermentans TaxID=43671 RepID=A0A511Z229_9CELL|nr:MFS transporter [Actinotalea fermentans]KGM16454.1 MFS transporter [Actinotalea fermentans ATCC 43279 = JCM 9966 = DSM 3133]GEN81446.1 multidrug efflux MFS transporter NorB [Actinotalea fermentans]
MNATQAVETPATPTFKGNDKLLIGIVLGVLTFWMFAGTVGTVARTMLTDLNGGAIDEVANPLVTVDQMNFAVSITALFSGLFIVFMGGLADRVGRVRIAITGNFLGMAGSLLLVLAGTGATLPMLLTGRALQGLSAACIMPSTMALLKAYWDGAGRQRAVSMWSIGSWGGSGVAAIFGGFVASNLTWQTIFYVSIAVSAVAIALMWGTPESKADASTHRRFDLPGLLIFMVTVLALMVVLIFGRQIGWTSATTLGLAAVAVVGGVVFFLVERSKEAPFIDFKLFRNPTFSGATLSNFLLNATIGLLIVSQQMLQLARPELFDPWKAGLLTIGYAVTIIGFIRVGEKLLRRFGPRKPMVWGASIVALSCAFLVPTNVLVGQYEVLAVIAYSLFGIGLAFYATPSTDAALSNLPPAQAGAGAGIYKMASSLGGAIGAALSLTIFTSFLGSGVSVLGELLVTQGMHENEAIRQAGMITFMFNLILSLIAVISILATVPKGRKYYDD